MIHKNNYNDFSILVVEDDLKQLSHFQSILESAGLKKIILCSDSRDVINILKSKKVDLILLDLYMPYISGELILNEIIKEYSDIKIIIVTGDLDIDTAVRCMKKGAFYYIAKPILKKRFLAIVFHALNIIEVERKNESLNRSFPLRELEHPEYFKSLITQNEAMHSILRYVEIIAKTSYPILITGETGTGKGLLANIIHKISGRTGEFVSINIAGIDDSIFSDTLFGHKKGSFTGAFTDRYGLIKKAEGGTLFLDEIGDLSTALQVKLLRFLEEKTYYPLGSDKLVAADSRIIMTTNKDLERLIDSNAFRSDLYYRINKLRISLPPLRQRRDDIPLLVDNFITQTAKELNKKKPTVPKELFTILNNYNFPGNIRELKGLLENALLHHTSMMLSNKSFNKLILAEKEPSEKKENITLTLLFNKLEKLPSIDEMKIALIKEALKRTDNNISMAAKMINISRQSIIRLLKSKSNKGGVK